MLFESGRPNAHSAQRTEGQPLWQPGFMHRPPEQFMVCIDHALKLEMSLGCICFQYNNTKIIVVYHICPNTRCAMRECRANVRLY